MSRKDNVTNTYIPHVVLIYSSYLLYYFYRVKQKMKTDINEVKKVVRSLLLSSKNGLSVNELCSEYSAITSQALPYKELGFFSAVDLVKDMPDVVRPIFLSGGVMLLRGIADSTTAHINELVRSQKSVRYNTKLIKDQVKNPVKQVVPDYVRNKLMKLLDRYPRGIEISALEKVYVRFYGRKLDCTSFGFYDLKSVLLKCEDMVTVKRAGNLTFAYPIILSNIKPLMKPLLPSSVLTKPSKMVVNSITVPQSVQMEIYSLLTKFQKGLSASTFMSEYEKCFQKPFKLHEIGFHSIIELMSRIPNIVQIKRPQFGGDWVLYSVASDEKLPSIVTNSVSPITPAKQIGETMEIYISYIISPSSFWYQDVKSVDALDELMEKMNVFYNSPKSMFYSANEFKTGQVCCALYEEDQQWYRATIKTVVSKEIVVVHYVDYGNESKVNKTSLRLLLQEFFLLPFQAHPGKLAKIIPNNDLWSEKAIKEFFNLTQDKHLYTIVSKIERITNLDLFLTQERSENVAHIMSSKGFATTVNQLANETTSTPTTTKSMETKEQLENLKNFYVKYYNTLKDVSALSQPLLNQPPTTSSTITNHNQLSTDQSGKNSRTLKTVKLDESTLVHIFQHKKQPFVASAEISHLFWSADILRQMTRQKGIVLPKDILSSEDYPEILNHANNHDIPGIIDCGNGKSIILYSLVGLLQLFDTFKPKHQNSRDVIGREINSWKELQGDYWQQVNIELTETESNAMKLQALKFKKKRLYLSMITNSANSTAMDEILAIEKEINLLIIS